MCVYHFCFKLCNLLLALLPNVASKLGRALELFKGHVNPIIGRLGLGPGTKALCTWQATNSGKGKCTGIMQIFCSPFLTEVPWRIHARAKLEGCDADLRTGIMLQWCRYEVWSLKMMKAILWKHGSLKEKCQFASLPLLCWKTKMKLLVKNVGSWVNKIQNSHGNYTDSRLHLRPSSSCSPRRGE